MSGGVNGAPSETAVVAYLQRMDIENIRSIASLAWEVTPGPGWNVVLGDNGSGKSTFLRTIAAMLMTPTERGAIPFSGSAWVGTRASSGTVELIANVRTADGTDSGAIP